VAQVPVPLADARGGTVGRPADGASQAASETDITGRETARRLNRDGTATADDGTSSPSGSSPGQQLTVPPPAARSGQSASS
jgi:hypothetical protein